MPHKDIICSGFPQGFAHLASVSRISATRLALARSLITLGPSHTPRDFLGPFWWSLRGVVTIYSLLSSDLLPTSGFRRLTASQRKGDAFLLGEALTHWFAQTHLRANVVVPLERHIGTLVTASTSAPYPKQMPKYFRHGIRLGAKSEPDFLAFSTGGQVHVIESKGRAGFNMYGVTEKEINAARNRALRQVCRVATVNGIPPLTRTACVFAFDRSGLTGQITDPPETRTYNLIAEWPALIKQAYAAVLNPLFENAARDIGGSFVGIEFLPGWRFGVDRRVYDLVRGVNDAKSAEQLLNHLADFPPDEDDSHLAEERSIGRDGLVLMGDQNSSRKIWCRELF